MAAFKSLLMNFEGKKRLFIVYKKCKLANFFKSANKWFFHFALGEICFWIGYFRLPILLCLICPFEGGNLDGHFTEIT